MATPARRRAEGHQDYAGQSRNLTLPSEDKEAKQLLAYKAARQGACPSPPETPKSQHFLSLLQRGGGRKSSGSLGYSTADPVADYLHQQGTPQSQQSAFVNPGPSAAHSGPSNTAVLHQGSPLTSLESRFASLQYQPSLIKMDSRFLAPVAAAAAVITKQKERTMQIAKEQQQALAARLKRDNLEMPPFEFLELIGKGAFGRVFKAHDKTRNKEVALKVVDVDPHDFKVHFREKDESIETVMHEIQILTQLRDSGAKNINLIIDAFPIHSQLWIVTEYCPGGSLHTLMQGVGSKLEEKYIIPVARELAIALRAIHAAGIIHRDVKVPHEIAANVMIHEKGSLQLIDFGVAGLLQTSKDKRSTIIGTPHWMAPEMSSQLVSQGPSTLDYATEVSNHLLRRWRMNNSLTDTLQVDVWAYGCTLFEIATGNPPYHRAEPGRKLTMMLKRSAPTLNEKDFSAGLVDLIKFVMKPLPQDRPSMQAILQHPYLLGTEEEYPTRSLADLVKMYYRWEYSGGQRSSLFMPGGAEAATFPTIGDDEEEWNFSTTINFDKQNSAPYLAGLQHAGSTQDLTFDYDSNPTHIAAVAANRSATSNHPSSASHKPRSSLNLAFSMSDAPEMATSAASLDPKNEPKINVTDPLGSVSATSKGNVERGEKSLQAIFDQSAPDYQYGAEGNAEDSKANNNPEPVKPTLDRSKSDLPLRNAASGVAVHKEVDKSGIVKTPSIDLANVGTIKANRINSRSGQSLDKQGSEDSDGVQKGFLDSAKRATMEWTFAAAQEAPEAPEATMPARAANRATLDWSFELAGTVDENENEEDVSATRPGLGRMVTQPVGNFDPRPKSVLDLDALYESEMSYESSTAPASDDEAYAAYDLSDAQDPLLMPAPIQPNSPPKPPAHPLSSWAAPAKLKVLMLEEMHYKYEVDGPLAERIIIGDRSDPNDLTHGNEQFAEDLVDDWLAENHAKTPFHLKRALKRDIMDARLDVFNKYLSGDYPFEKYEGKYDHECLGEIYDSDGEDGHGPDPDDSDFEHDGDGDETEHAGDDNEEDDDPAPVLKEVDMKAALPGASDEVLKAELVKQLDQLGNTVLPWASRQIGRMAEEEGVVGDVEEDDEDELTEDLEGLQLDEGEEAGDEA
ncbi:MAG: hypothetical protein Q9181_003650 [Wetmoreana brouardii]